MSVARTYLIDTDTHVTEPKDLWTSRMSRKKWGNLIPEVRHVSEEEGEVWFVNDKPLFSVGCCMTAPGPDGRPVRSSTYPMFTKTHAEMHPSGYDAKERLKVLDMYGIHAVSMDIGNCPWADMRTARRWPIRTAQWRTRICP
ncbi:hypothetical protein BHQ17_23080 [Mycolicibacterium holsaticum]|uniref:Amidohydrolase-related domain-containing protein n=1 Tax=Mycolicibacterium holsaticum TaxID=152142 RepID=A0A1E3R6E0_9MYCO|nr:hypothetical protein BHQ17_23080 [Mycolicibacterium holsaticum]